MSLSITMKQDAFPDGTEFHVEGIGVIKNNETVEITEEQEHAFIAANRTLIADSMEGSEIFQVSGSPIVTSVKDSLGVDPAEISDSYVPSQQVQVVDGQAQVVEVPNLTATNNEEQNDGTVEL